MTSIFTDKKTVPDIAALKTALGKTFAVWQEIESITLSQCAQAKGQWNYSGQKFGWSYRISDRKRVIIYLLPRDQFFKVAFVFGQKAFDKILEGSFDNSIKQSLQAAATHAEGRGIRIEVRDKKIIKEIRKLVGIKLSQ